MLPVSSFSLGTSSVSNEMKIHPTTLDFLTHITLQSTDLPIFLPALSGELQIEQNLISQMLCEHHKPTSKETSQYLNSC